MNNNQDNEIVVLIQDVIAGNAEKKELCNRIYKEVYALAYPVYQDEEKSMTQAKKALIEVCNRIEDINLSKNVHKQVATIVSAYFFVSAVSEYENELKNDYVMREYNYSRIREDEELLGYMKKKAGVFRSPKVFDEEGKEFASLNPVQMALMEMYAYEMQSVETIERITDVDSSYIASWIAGVKEAVIEGYEAVAAAPEEEALSQTQDSEEAGEEAYEEPEHEELQDDEEAIDYNDTYEEKRAVSSVYKRAGGHRENSVTMFIKKIFPALSLPARKAISWAVGCVVVIVLVSVLFVSAIAGKNNKKKVSKDYDYQDMQYYTTKQSSTTKQDKTEESSDNTAETEAVTQDKTTQKETESSKQVVVPENNNADNRVTTAADDGDNRDSGNSGSNDSGNSDSGNSGSDDSGNSGNDNSGSDDSGNSGNDNSGSDDSGNSGNGNSGSDDSGNSGNGNSGSNDSGNGGNGNSGSDDSGNGGNGNSGSNDSGNGGNGNSGSNDSGNGGNGNSGSNDSGNGNNGKNDSGDDSKTDDNESDFGGGIIIR